MKRWVPRVWNFFATQAPKHESLDKIAELEAEKGDAKMPLAPCILALIDETLDSSHESC